MSVTRYDIGALQKARKTTQGFLRVDAYLTRTGIFEYRNADGTVRREFRPPEQVFDSETLDSFAGAPVTDDHPPEMVSIDNAQKYQRGYLAEAPRRDDRFVRANILVTDPKLVEKMQAGKVQVSCGYVCDLEPTPGEWRGEKYDAVQKNIRGNHVAIVDVGRAGAECAARMDSGTPIQEKALKTVTLNAIKFDVADEALASAVEQTVAGLTATAEKNAGRADAAEKALGDEKAARKADADAHEKALAAVTAAQPDLVKARVALEKTAGAILGEAVKLDSLSDRDVKAAVIEKVTGEKPAAERSDDYVEGAYGLAVKQVEKAGNPALAKLRAVVDASEKTDAGGEKADIKAKRDAEENLRNAWKKKA